MSWWGCMSHNSSGDLETNVTWNIVLEDYKKKLFIDKNNGGLMLSDFGLCLY